jgi:hypothetical protein
LIKLKKQARPWSWLLVLVLVSSFSFYAYGVLLRSLGSLWLAVPLTILAGKLAADLVSWGINRALPFTFFEDYLRELFLFLVVGLIAAAVVFLSQTYLGGAVWVPLLSGAVVVVWSR